MERVYPLQKNGKAIEKGKSYWFRTLQSYGPEEISKFLNRLYNFCNRCQEKLLETWRT